MKITAFCVTTGTWQELSPEQHQEASSLAKAEVKRVLTNYVKTNGGMPIQQK